MISQELYVSGEMDCVKNMIIVPAQTVPMLKTVMDISIESIRG